MIKMPSSAGYTQDDENGRKPFHGISSDETASFRDYSIDNGVSTSTLRRRRTSKLAHFHEMDANSSSINTGTQKKAKDFSALNEESTVLSQSSHQRLETFRTPLQENMPLSSRVSGEGVPEVHWVGEIIRASGFNNDMITCKWDLEWGDSWAFLEGEFSGQSQFAISSDDGAYIWNHPLDIHFACTSLRGWPRLILQVWELDEYNRLNLIGYGFTHLPSAVGEAYLTIPCWRPCQSVKNEMKDFFLGSSTSRHDSTIVYGKAWDVRHSIITIPLGQIQIRVSTITRHMIDQSVDMI